MSKKQYSVPQIQLIAADNADIICVSVKLEDGDNPSMYSKKMHAVAFDDEDELDDDDIFMQSDSILQ